MLAAAGPPGLHQTAPIVRSGTNGRETANTQTATMIAAVILVACYARILNGMFDQWWNDPDMGHGFLVPVFISWVVWNERDRWRGLPLQPTAWGLAVLAVAAAVHFLSLIGGGLFVGSLAMVWSVAGIVLCLGGLAFLRVWTFPFLLGLLMLPKLAIVYNFVTLPLQLLASRLAVAMLAIVGAVATREGNIIDAGGHRIAVAEACNGIRYLLSLGFVAIVFAYLSDAKPWMRIALLATAVPVAILANAVRVAASASIPMLDNGMPHTLAGLFIFSVCLALLAAARRLLNAAYTIYHA